MKEFLITGNFGPIRFGMTRQQVIDILGEPDEWGSHRDLMSATLWKYGRVEFYFNAPRRKPTEDAPLYGIFSDYLNPLRGYGNLVLDPWILSDTLTQTDAAAALEREQIQYTVKLNPIVNHVVFVLQSGVELAFHYPDESNSRFYSSEVIDDRYLFAFSYMDMCSEQGEPTKQVSITLPLPLHIKLRREAVKRGCSVSELSSQWLFDRLKTLPDDEANET